MASGKSGMFGPGDYLPFIIGIIIFGGFGAIPFIWGKFLEMEYVEALPWALFSCIMYIISFRKDGSISWVRFIVAIIILNVAARMAIESEGGTGFAAGGFVGFIVIVLCGYVGIWISKIFRKRPQIAS